MLFLADHLDGTLAHLNHHDVSLVCVSRAPLDKIEAYKRRMGWKFPWVSSHGSRFNFDFGVSFTTEQMASGSVVYKFPRHAKPQAHDELPGQSAFYRDGQGQIFHTYSSYARGGRGMAGYDDDSGCGTAWPQREFTMNFIKRHDEYETAPKTGTCCH